MLGELQFVPQLNPRELLLIFALKSAGEIVQLLKKSVDEPPESQESESVLNKTAAHVSESQYMLYMYHVAQKLRHDISSNSYNNCFGINTENAANYTPKSLNVFLRLLCTDKDPKVHEDDNDSEIALDDPRPKHVPQVRSEELEYKLNQFKYSH